MAQQDTLVYVELSVALPVLLPTLYLASSGTPHGTERLSEQDEECLKVGLFATAPIGFIVANDHQRSTVRLLKIKCFSPSLSSPSLEEGRHKKQWCSFGTSCWFLNEGVLAAHSGSFWLPFTPTMVKRSCIMLMWCRKPALKGFHILCTTKELLLFVISCAPLKWIFIFVGIFEIKSRIEKILSTVFF